MQKTYVENVYSYMQYTFPISYYSKKNKITLLGGATILLKVSLKKKEWNTSYSGKLYLK
jgi:hypothetical protein